jgi:hypothetical protein
MRYEADLSSQPRPGSTKGNYKDRGPQEHHYDIPEGFAENPVKRPRSRKKIKAPAAPDEVDFVKAGSHGRKTPVDLDYRADLVVSNRKSASEFLSSLWRRGAATPDPYLEKVNKQGQGHAKSSRMRLFRPKSESRQGVTDGEYWAPDGRRSVSELRPYGSGSDESRGRSSSRRPDEGQLRRNRAKSVDCLQYAAEIESRSSRPSSRRSGVPVSSGGWVNAFSKSMTSLVPEHMFSSSHHASGGSSGSGAARKIQKQSQSKSKLFDPNDTIDSRKSKTSSRSAKSKTSLKSESKRKSRKDLMSVLPSSEESRIGIQLGSPSRISAYSTSSGNSKPPSKPAHSKSIENIFSRSKSRSREVLDDPKLFDPKPAKIEFGVQVLPRQFQKRSNSSGNANKTVVQATVEAQPKPAVVTQEPQVALTPKKHFYFGMETHQAAVEVSKTSKPTSPERVSIKSSSAVEFIKDKAPVPKAPQRTKSKDLVAGDDDLVEKFASRLQSTVARTESSDSYAERAESSVVTSSRRGGESAGGPNSTLSNSDDEQDIPVKLRPVLPRKHLDMPRFSPTAAWRGIVTGQEAADDDPDFAKKQAALLRKQHAARKNSVGNQSTQSSNEPDFLEEQIIKESSSRQNLAGHQFRNGHEKSADSGISGDAGSPGPTLRVSHVEKCKEVLGVEGRPLAASSPVNHHHAPTSPGGLVRNWTPEQDLDDSMGEGSHASPRHNGLGQPPAGKATPPKLTHRTVMFPGYGAGKEDSGSLPKQARKPGEPQSFSSLRKLKRSASGAPHHEQATSSTNSKLRSKTPEGRLSVDDNWSLSRSVPNSLDMRDVKKTGSRYQLQEAWSDVEETHGLFSRQEDEFKVSSVHVSKSTRYTTNGHIVYLPEYKSIKVEEKASSARPRSALNDGYTLEDDSDAECNQPASRPHSVHGDALEFAPPHIRRETSPGSELTEGQRGLGGIAEAIRRKGKKFTYQSTVRQIERKRVEQQLSKEAEEKEKQRLREQAVIQQVEEEFRRKRSKEKSSIQDQLLELHRTTLQEVHQADEANGVVAGEKVLENGKSVIVAGTDTYAVPNKPWRATNGPGPGLVQVRPFKSHLISIAEKSGIPSPPAPPLSPPPPLTSDDYLPQPAPMLSPSASSSSSALTPAGSPSKDNAAANGSFVNGLKPR